MCLWTAAWGQIRTDISIEPSCVSVSGELNAVELPGTVSSEAVSPAFAGAPPIMLRTVMLPPGTRVEQVELIDPQWITVAEGLPRGTFANAGPGTAGLLRQGSAMGYRAAAVFVSPLRFSEDTGTLELLASGTIEITTGPLEGETLTPLRESPLSAAVRSRGIESMISGTGSASLYPPVPVEDPGGSPGPLQITEFPSLQGDCADMVIVTTEALQENFQQLAQHRTSRGIVTTVRTVEWIEQHYSGCDTQERIRNFLRDAHEYWGIQAVLLGGDHEQVPARETGGWSYIPVPFPACGLPSDDYYGDLDGDWSYDGSVWRVLNELGYLDICTGRWPVNSPGDVETMMEKLLLYEAPPSLPDDFARRVLLLGSNNPAGAGADDMALLGDMLRNGAVPSYLDEPVELYYPHELPQGDLNRNNALNEIDEGYNLIVHAGHGEIHKLGTAGNGTLGQYMWDSDFATMQNSGQPSILWTLGCDPAHFDGAFSFAEAGLLTSGETGLVAAIANPRMGMHQQKTTAYLFCDALFGTGYTAMIFQRQALHWPLTFLGEAYRTSKNLSEYSYLYLNLLGDPMMTVWRDDPGQLQVTASPLFLAEGISSQVTVEVRENGIPVPGATVVIWKAEEVYAAAATDVNGTAAFQGVIPLTGGQNEYLQITALKPSNDLGAAMTAPAPRLPGTLSVGVLDAQGPVVAIQEQDIDPQGDGAASPGETVTISLTAANSGGSQAQGPVAVITVVQGVEFLESIPCGTAVFPDIEPGGSSASIQDIQLEIAQDAPEGAAILLQADISCPGFQGSSPLLVTVNSPEYQLTVCDPWIEGHTDSTVITISGMLLANTGLSEDEWVQLTASGVTPCEPFTVSTVQTGTIPGNSAENVPGTIHLTITPQSPDSPWLKKDFPGCSFQVTAVSPSVNQTAAEFSAAGIHQLQQQQVPQPDGLSMKEAGNDFISLTWEHPGAPSQTGYYVYINGERTAPVPIPVKEITVTGLEPSTEYTLGVSAVDLINRESDPAEIQVSTARGQVSGWPLNLSGSPGAGPLAEDLDGDGAQELAAGTSFGDVFIMERNGSFQKLSPPAGFQYDRLLGISAGDVTGDGKPDIVAAYQQHIELQGQERISLVLFSSPGSIWTSSEIASTNTDEELSSTITGGSPLLVQANGSPELEIALRTRGSNGGTPHLYLWKRTSPGTWESFSSDFPMPLSGGFFDTPSAADIDEDGLEELFTTTYSTGEPGTSILAVDFHQNGTITTSVHDLPELNTGGQLTRAFGTMAVTERQGTFYIAGAAKPESFCSTMKKLFVLTVEKTDAVAIDILWQTGWLEGRDYFGNMPGPSLAPVSGTSEPEVIYLLNGGLYQSEGIITGFDLLTGETVFQGEPTPFDPVAGAGGADIRSQAVAGAVTAPGSGESAVFTGFSTTFAGIDPSLPGTTVPGFPGYSRDGVWAAPVIADMDQDGSVELLFIDNSGQAALYDLQEYGTSPNPWPMYQANPRRTGFLESPDTEPGLDISLTMEQSAPLSQGRGTAVLVEIDGLEQPCDRALVTQRRTVTVAMFSEGQLAGSTEVPLENGLHRAILPRAAANSRISADPWDEYSEADETNNELLCSVVEDLSISVPSPSRELAAELAFPEGISDDIEWQVYSIDGRTVARGRVESLPQGTSTLSLEPPGGLPPGLYIVRFTGVVQRSFEAVLLR